MLPITQSIVPADLPTRSHLPMQPLWITIHETANPNKGADAEMHARYVLTPEAQNRTVLWHYSVDCDSIVQHLPTNEVGWHAGDGYDGPGNRKSIGVELCINSDGSFSATQILGARLVAHLVTTIPSLRPFPECLVQHSKWSGKNCPAVIRGTSGAWDAFVKLCGEEIAKLKAPAWDPAAEVARLKERGVINTLHDPAAPVTWATFATVLNRILDQKG